MEQIHGCVEFSQSPQVLLRDKTIRIYYSTRFREKNGKFLSHISFVDFDPLQLKIVGFAKQEVIPLGKEGTFDEHGIFPINIIRDGVRTVAYTCGWSRRKSVSVETSIGIAISEDDGDTFKKIGNGPIMSSTHNEPFLVGDPFVIKRDEKYHMWYIYGKRWVENEVEEPARVYKIAYARSKNGIDWERSGECIIPDVLNEDECQALPTVAYFDGLFHMFFCYREAIGFRTEKGKGYRLGYAYSEDMMNWKRDDKLGGMDLSGEGWDSEMQCYPHLFIYGENLYLLYNGNQFGKAGFGMARLIS
ncbi:MAG: hypothetical protein ACK452_12985 [Bacteroidota bacterium]